MRWSTLAACVALSLGAAPAAAQGHAPADAQTAARTRAEEGLTLFKDGRWAEAYAAFADADRMFHAPTLVTYMGTCRRNQRRLVEAKALYEKVIAEPVQPGAPEAFKKAVETARSELDKLRERIPVVKVKLAGPGAEQATVTIDGVALTPAEIASGKPLDVGDHTIVADALGASGRAKVTLKEGETPSVEVQLVASGATSDDKPRGSMLPAGIALGLGGAGLAAGAVLGLIARSKISEAHEGCTEPDASGVRHCPPGNEPAANAARGLGVGSGVALGIGAAGVVTGVVLAIVRPGGAKRDKIGLDIGPGLIAIRGRF